MHMLKNEAVESSASCSSSLYSVTEDSQCQTADASETQPERPHLTSASKYSSLLLLFAGKSELSYSDPNRVFKVSEILKE